MATLDSNFGEDDLNLLIEAITEWENHDRQMLSLIWAMKNNPLPADMTDDIKEAMERVKAHYLSKEKALKSQAQLRSERSILIKAKIIMQKQDRAIDQL